MDSHSLRDYLVTLSGDDPRTPEDEAEDTEFKTSLGHRRHLEDKSSY